MLSFRFFFYQIFSHRSAHEVVDGKDVCITQTKILHLASQFVLRLRLYRASREGGENSTHSPPTRIIYNMT